MTTARTVQGKVALVTGANRGLGAAFVEALMARGASKVYCGARDLTKLQPALDRFPGRTAAVELDVTDGGQIRAAGKRWTDVDILISNAGVTYITPLLETNLADARRVMETNYFGPLQLIYAFADTLRARGGGFIYVLSLAGLLPARGAELYSASKAAGSMLGLAAHAALESVAVSLVYPGLTDTDMMRSAPVAKTPPREVADRALDGWERGELSVFPDLHAQLVREALVSEASEVLTDPHGVMRNVSVRYARRVADR